MKREQLDRHEHRAHNRASVERFRTKNRRIDHVPSPEGRSVIEACRAKGARHLLRRRRRPPDLGQCRRYVR